MRHRHLGSHIYYVIIILPKLKFSEKQLLSIANLKSDISMPHVARSTRENNRLLAREEKSEGRGCESCDEAHLNVARCSVAQISLTTAG